MNNKGFIFTLDAVLALIPVFIIILAISSSNTGELVLPSQQMRLSHQAQDTLDAMSNFRHSDLTLIEEISRALNADDENTARTLAREFLDINLPLSHYELVEINKLKGNIIASNGDIDKASNVAVGTKIYGNYIYKLYVWD